MFVCLLAYMRVRVCVYVYDGSFIVCLVVCVHVCGFPTLCVCMRARMLVCLFARLRCCSCV